MQSYRWKTLDIIKALTVPSMIIVHNTIWWLSYHHFAIASATASWFQVTRVLAFFVMLIPATAGAALFFYLKQHRNESLPKFTTILRRAIFLSFAGFAMNIAAFGFDSIFHWNVLQFFSVSMVVIYLFLRFSNIFFLSLFGLTTLFTAPILRSLFESLSNNYVTGIFIGSHSGIHIWPFFPWFAIITIGFLIAYTFHNQKSETYISYVLLVCGMLLMLLAHSFNSLLYVIDFKNLWGELIFQPPTMQIIGTIGVLIYLFGFVHLFFKNTITKPFGLVSTLSAGLFYIYIFHMIVGHQIQLHFLKHTYNLDLLWWTILFQLIAAYLIGVLVQYLKLKSAQSSPTIL